MSDGDLTWDDSLGDTRSVHDIGHLFLTSKTSFLFLIIHTMNIVSNENEKGARSRLIAPPKPLTLSRKPSETRSGRGEGLEICRCILFGIDDLFDDMIVLLHWDSLHLLDHETTESHFTGRPPIAEASLTTGRLHQLDHCVLTDAAHIVAPNDELQTPVRNTRSGQTHCRFGTLVFEITLTQEGPPWNVALVIVIQELAEVIHEFQEVKQGRRLGRRDALLPRLHMLSSADDGRHNVLRRHSHATIIGTAQLGTR